MSPTCAEHRADLDLHIDLLTEYELTKGPFRCSTRSRISVGIENDQDTELAELESETKPEEVLAEIERLQRRVLRPSRVPTQPKSHSASA